MAAAAAAAAVASPRRIQLQERRWGWRGIVFVPFFVLFAVALAVVVCNYYRRDNDDDDDDAPMNSDDAP